MEQRGDSRGSKNPFLFYYLQERLGFSSCPPFSGAVVYYSWLLTSKDSAIYYIFFNVKFGYRKTKLNALEETQNYK